MVRTSAPLFSLDASGSIANALEYFTLNGRTCCRKYKVPRNPNTPAQQTIRITNSFLSGQWQAIVPADRATFGQRAVERGIAPYHEYLSYNMLRWNSQRPPSKSWPATEDDTLPTTIGENVLNFFGTSKIFWAWQATLEQSWATIAYLRSTIGTPSREDLRWFISNNNPVGYTLLGPPMPSGTYYAYTRHFTRLGNQGHLNGPWTVIIP